MTPFAVREEEAAEAARHASCSCGAERTVESDPICGGLELHSNLHAVEVDYRERRAVSRRSQHQGAASAGAFKIKARESNRLKKNYFPHEISHDFTTFQKQTFILV